VAQLKVGNGMDSEVTQGPLINVPAAEKVADSTHVNIGLKSTIIQLILTGLGFCLAGHVSPITFG